MIFILGFFIGFVFIAFFGFIFHSVFENVSDGGCLTTALAWVIIIVIVMAMFAM